MALSLLPTRCVCEVTQQAFHGRTPDYQALRFSEGGSGADRGVPDGLKRLQIARCSP